MKKIDRHCLNVEKRKEPSCKDDRKAFFFNLFLIIGIILASSILWLNLLTVAVTELGQAFLLMAVYYYFMPIMMVVGIVFIILSVLVKMERIHL